jgi:beta-lactamase class C
VKRLISSLLLACAAMAPSLPAEAQKAPRSAAKKAPAPPPVPPYNAPATFAEALERASTAPDFVGLAVAVVRDGKIELIKTYGTRSADSSAPITPDTQFRIASLSKAFAATLAAQDVKAGKLHWSDPVLPLSPTFKLKNGKEAAVTVEDVLSHRVGLPPYAYDNLLEADELPADILAKYSTVKLTCEPHTCFGYQNTAYNMIAPMLEKAGGAPYAILVRKRIFEPLGMKTATVGRDGLVGSINWAAPHRRRGGAWVPVPVKEPYYRVPAAGGVNLSITDLARWLSAQMGFEPALPPDIVAEITKPRVVTPQESSRQRALRTPVTSTSYGLGWRIATYAGHKLVNHSGSVEGYISQIAYLPDRKVGIVVLSNTRGARALKILPAWLDYELNLKKTDWLGLDDLAAAAAEEGPEGQ